MNLKLLKVVFTTLFTISTFLLPINANAACDQPSQLQATANGTSVSFTWTGSGTGYLIEVENTVTDQTVIPESNVSSPHTSTFTAGSYKFKIRTLCGKDKSNWSDWMSFSVGGATNPPTGGGSGGGSTVCNIPTLLAASATTTGATLTWTGTSGAYQIEVENTATDVNVVPEQSASSPFNVTLSAGNYKFKVRSVCGGDHSDWSATFSFTIGSSSNPPSGVGSGGGSTICNIPTQLASSISGNDIKLSWLSDAASFQIEVEKISNDSTIIPESNTVNPFFGNLPDGVYKFKVRSICSSEKTDWTAWSSFVVNGATPVSGDPTVIIDTTCKSSLNISVINAKDTSLTLKWPSAGKNARYNVELESEETAIKFRFKKEDIRDTFLIINGLNAGSQYKIEITVNCGNGLSTASSTLQSSTPLLNPTVSGGASKFTCDAPAGLSVKIETGGILFSWLASQGARSYQIELESQENTPAFNRTIAVSINFFFFNTSLPAGKYKIKVRASCQFGKGSWSSPVSFNLLQALSLEVPKIENKLVRLSNSVEIYPNPTSDLINVKVNDIRNQIEMQLISTNGQIIKKWTVPQASHTIQINIKPLLSGMYYLKINSGYEQTIKKIMVQ